jgi:hypothetical protein
MASLFDESDEEFLERIFKSVIFRVIFIGIILIVITCIYIIIDCFMNNVQNQCTSATIVTGLMILVGILIIGTIMYYAFCKKKKPTIQEEHTLQNNPMKESKEKESTINHISLDMPITSSTKPTNLVIKNPMLKESLPRSSSKDSISSRRSIESIDSSPRRSRSSSKDSFSPKRDRKYKNDESIFTIENPM